MFGQSFQPGDIGTVGFLVVLEALLSVDNALVLAILVRHLPHDQQKKALMYGMGGAFVLRTIAIILAALIIDLWWVQLGGALYLLYLPIKHFIDVGKGRDKQGKKMGFWPTVVYLNIVDLAFALDSVIVAVAVVNTVKNPNKLWVVVAGALIGIVILRFAANYFIRLLEKYPMLDHVAYALVGWAGVKLLFIGAHTSVTWYGKHFGELEFEVPEMPALVFWIGMALIAVVGFFIATRCANKEPLHDDQEEALRLYEDRETS